MLKNAGVGYGDYVEQITYLLFLKLAEEMSDLGFDNPIPAKFGWSVLSSKSGDDLEVHYRHTLENLGKVTGLAGIIFRKAQNKISNPSDLQRVIKMIGDEDWSGMGVDIKEQTKLAKQLTELADWERDVIYPLATQRLEIDLDDGVKANYPKFGKALARIPGVS